MSPGGDAGPEPGYRGNFGRRPPLLDQREGLHGETAILFWKTRCLPQT